MKVIILGGGMGGCTAAYLLKKKGYDVTIIEDKIEVGGVCQTNEFGGIRYEFGPHILYAEGKIRKFFEEHLENNVHPFFPKACLNGNIDELYDFPLSFETINRLPEKIRMNVMEELYKVDYNNPDYSNFESYIISRVGITLYELFIKYYNVKQWGVAPKELDITWAKCRPFSISKKSSSRFGDKWQGHPGSYKIFFENMIKDVNIIHGRVENVEQNGSRMNKIIFKEENGSETSLSGDFIISTLPLDAMMGKEGLLSYRNTLKIFTLLKAPSAMQSVWTTFPNSKKFLRVFEYKKQSLQEHENTLISFSFQTSSNPLNIKEYFLQVKEFIDESLKMKIIDHKPVYWEKTYPVPTKVNEENFRELLKDSCDFCNFATIGRLGLFSYISMDTCVGQSMTICDNLDVFINGSKEDRLKIYSTMRAIQS